MLPSLPLSQHTLGSHGDGASDLKFKKKQKKVTGMEYIYIYIYIYIYDCIAKDLTDLSDFKITFLIIIYSLSLLLITNCNKEKKKVHHNTATPGTGLWWLPVFFATSCLSTHRLFPAGTEQRASSGLCLSVCMVFLMGAFRGRELPFAEHPQQTLGSEPFRPDYIRGTLPLLPPCHPPSLSPCTHSLLQGWACGFLGAPDKPNSSLPATAPTGKRLLALCASSSPVTAGKSAPS